MNKSNFLSILLIVIAGLAVYSNSLNGEFVWDDKNLIKENAHVQSWANLPRIFGQDVGAGALEKYPHYRPLQTFTYMLNYSLGKFNVWGYHLTNILIHILVALSVYWLANILFADKLISFLAGIFFVIHPIHTEAVAYISGRADSLAALFMLFCFIFYLKYLQLNNATFYFLSLFSFILALLSRENSLILPILLLLYHYAFKKRIKFKIFLPLSAITCIYILLRFTALGSLLPHRMTETTILQRLPGVFVAFSKYLGLLLLPFNLHMDYGNQIFGFAHPQAIIGIFIFFFLCIYIFRQRKSGQMVFFSLSWFLFTFLPVSNLYPISAYMSEHWLYLPSLGLFVVSARGLSYLYRKKQLKSLGILFIICLLCFYGFLTFKQNYYWREPFSFYERTIKYNPQSVKAHNNLANLYSINGEQEKAITLFKRTLELDPDYAEGYNNLGVAYHLKGDLEEAIASYKKAIELRAHYPKAYHNLSVAYFDKRQYKSAVQCFEKAKEMGLTDPEYFKTIQPYMQANE